MKLILQLQRCSFILIGVAMIAISCAQKQQELSIQMIYVEGGTFQMGSNDSDANDNENPVHTVTLSSFYISKHEVTQEQWLHIMGSSPSAYIGTNKPCVLATWYDCVQLCNALSRKEGLEECYNIIGEVVYQNIDCNGYRLPTEAEWEFAAGGGNKSKDYKYPGGNNPSDVAWYSNNSTGTTNVVGLLNVNELGIYDMGGNISEWCWDWHGNYNDCS